ncbi:hypothetical protein K402DRAFT_442507 [Aulographum hederae CBS 113979]|uniref:Heterokaryon incompatibility domain-containing protein n=1 Tax=Aulographum hederae CBS 113979 TaxID=1176131 RepID=A0A6G1GJ08_9PEZI|nr:hypothetical protein K402DRAFT_442507 [Aulographum hederae CBS 113979]
MRLLNTTAKIQKFCKVALSRGFDWCWVDTCCIDKRSSAELTEAINSMFVWYWKAGACFAFLADELLAPTHLTFFDRKWKSLGDRNKLALSIWTSRLEDMAYCLLGLFNVNMLLLYGEGRKAFVRLQLEIIKKSNDSTIFVWNRPPEDRFSWPFKEKFSGMLALWPTWFRDSNDIDWRPRRTYT